MSNHLALAIDFGSSRTKVAWRDEQGNVSLVHFGDAAYLPTLFYLPQNSQAILLGQQALHAYEDEALGVVEVLKRLIEQNKPIYTTEDRTTDAQPLLDELFRYLKQYVLKNVPEFNELSPEQIVITVPGNAPMTLEIRLRHAASAVAWDHPQFIAEPVAAARYWLHGEGQEVGDTVLVVLDCGGGTTDWACLQRTGQRIYRAEQYKPSGISVGGSDVDQALSDWVAIQQPELFAVRPEPRLRDQLRVWKEAVFKGEEPLPILIKGNPLLLSENDLHRLYKETLIDKVLPAFERFLEPIVREHPDTQVLIVGGSATELMEQAVKSMHPNVARCDESLGAVILGALAMPGRPGMTKAPDEAVATKPALAEVSSDPPRAKMGLSEDVLNSIRERTTASLTLDITCAEDARELVEALNGNRTITYLACNANAYYEVDVDSEVEDIFAEFLKSNTTIRTFDLRGNLKGNSSHALANILRFNKTLTDLTLYCYSDEDQNAMSKLESAVISGSNPNIVFVTPATDRMSKYLSLRHFEINSLASVTVCRTRDLDPENMYEVAYDQKLTANDFRKINTSMYAFCYIMRRNGWIDSDEELKAKMLQLKQEAFQLGVTLQMPIWPETPNASVS